MDTTGQERQSRHVVFNASSHKVLEKRDINIAREIDRLRLTQQTHLLKCSVGCCLDSGLPETMGDNQVTGHLQQEIDGSTGKEEKNHRKKYERKERKRPLVSLLLLFWKDSNANIQSDLTVEERKTTLS